MLDSNKYADYTDYTAQSAMEDTLVAACERNAERGAAMQMSTVELPDDVDFIVDAYEEDFLSFVQQCTANLLFCCTALFHKANKLSHAETSVRTTNDQRLYTLGQSIVIGDSRYSMDEDAQSRLFDAVVHGLAERMQSRGFMVSVTVTDNLTRVFVSWCLDKDTAGHIFSITDYSQVNALMKGVPASDVFA